VTRQIPPDLFDGESLGALANAFARILPDDEPLFAVRLRPPRCPALTPRPALPLEPSPPHPRCHWSHCAPHGGTPRRARLRLLALLPRPAPMRCRLPPSEPPRAAAIGAIARLAR